MRPSAARPISLEIYSMRSPARRASYVAFTALTATAAFAALQFGAATAAPADDGCSGRQNLEQGSFLEKGQFLSSCNGENRLTFGGDGNVVVTRRGETVWRSGTAGLAGAERLIVRDGDLSIISDGPSLWEFDLGGEATRVQVADNGDVLFSRGDGDVTGRIPSGTATEGSTSGAVDTRPSLVFVRGYSTNQSSGLVARSFAELDARQEAPFDYVCSLRTDVTEEALDAFGGPPVRYSYDAETTGTCQPG